MLKAESLTFGTRLLQAGINFFMVVLLSRHLSVTDRGEAAFLLVLVAISLAFSEIAAGSTVVTIMHRFSFSAMYAVYVCWSFVVCFLAAVVLIWLNKMTIAIIVIWALAAWLLCLLTFIQHYFLGLRKWLIYNLLQGLSALLPLVFMAVFLLIKPQLMLIHYAWSLLMGWLLAAAVALVMAKKFVEKRQSGSDTALGHLVSAMFSRGIINQLSHVFSIGLNRLPYIFLPATALGIYANAGSLGEAIWMIPGSVGSVLYARKAGMANTTNAAKGVGKLLLVSTGLSAICYFVLLLLPPTLFVSVFGKAYTLIPLYVRWLAPGMMAFTVYLILSYWHSSRDLFSENLKAVVAGFSSALVFVWFVSQSRNLDVEMLISGQTLGWVTMSVWLLVSFVSKRKKVKNIAED